MTDNAISYEDFAKLELRVATILEAREHPNADKLMLLQIVSGQKVTIVITIS